SGVVAVVDKGERRAVHRGGADAARTVAEVPGTDVAIGGIEHGVAVRFAGGVGVVVVQHDLLGVVVAVDGIHQYPDARTPGLPVFDFVRQRRSVGLGEADVRTAGF